MLIIARLIFLAGALGVASLAVAAWSEPTTQVLSPSDRDYCPLPPGARQVEVQVQPDHDLLLFIYGLSHRGALG